MIDFRIRPPYGDFLKLGLFDNLMPARDLSEESPFSLERKRINSGIRRSMDLFMDEMDEAGIDIGVLMGRRTGTEAYGDVDNRQLYDLCRRYPGRFLAFGGINPFEPDCLNHIRHMAEAWGFRGVAIDPGWYATPVYADDDALMPVYEACARHGLIASITSSSHMGPDISHCDPAHIQHVAQRFPELNIVVPHACWPQTAGALGMALTCPNIWLMPDVYFYMPHMAFASEMAKAANSFLRKKILFASTYPGYGLSQAVKNWSAMPLTPGALLDTLHYNAHGLLGLDR